MANNVIILFGGSFPATYVDIVFPDFDNQEKQLFLTKVASYRNAIIDGEVVFNNGDHFEITINGKTLLYKVLYSRHSIEAKTYIRHIIVDKVYEQ